MGSRTETLCEYCNSAMTRINLIKPVCLQCSRTQPARPTLQACSIHLLTPSPRMPPAPRGAPPPLPSKARARRASHPVLAPRVPPRTSSLHTLLVTSGGHRPIRVLRAVPPRLLLPGRGLGGRRDGPVGAVWRVHACARASGTRRGRRGRRSASALPRQLQLRRNLSQGRCRCRCGLWQ